MVRFDVIVTNPPFQDPVKRGKTPHKLWIDFTLAVFDRLLAPGGSLVQVSPASFASPSNVVLRLMCSHDTKVLRLGTGRHFPEIASTFADYWIRKSEPSGEETTITTLGDEFGLRLNSSLSYLPNDLSRLAMQIHSKVMFTERPRLRVEWDYVVAHNIRRYDPQATLVEEEDSEHPYPVFHTNRSTWWSSIRQEWADEPKVMWSRSGYTKPFFDPGRLGGTDMVYFVRVASEAEGRALEHNLTRSLLRYILQTARWSGFGNERVFAALPDLPRREQLTDEQMFQHFGLNEEEVDYVERTMAPRRGASQ